MVSRVMVRSRLFSARVGGRVAPDQIRALRPVPLRIAPEAVRGRQTQRVEHEAAQVETTRADVRFGQRRLVSRQSDLQPATRINSASRFKRPPDYRGQGAADLGRAISVGSVPRHAWCARWWKAPVRYAIERPSTGKDPSGAISRSWIAALAHAACGHPGQMGLQRSVTGCRAVNKVTRNGWMT